MVVFFNFQKIFQAKFFKIFIFLKKIVFLIWRSVAKSVKRSFASKIIDILRQSFASRFLLRCAPLFLSKFKWPKYWLLSKKELKRIFFKLVKKLVSRWPISARRKSTIDLRFSHVLKISQISCFFLQSENQNPPSNQNSGVQNNGMTTNNPIGSSMNQVSWAEPFLLYFDQKWIFSNHFFFK